MPSNHLISRDSENPFPGLRAFTERERRLFFGREKQIDEIIARLASSQFLAVVGASGSGKSSLIRAGVIPELHNGRLTKAGEKWIYSLFRVGNSPLYNLAKALTQAKSLDKDIEIPELDIETAQNLLHNHKDGINRAIEKICPENHNFLLVIDQFEELIRYNIVHKQKQNYNQEANQFVSTVLQAIKQNDIPVYIIITLRSDFLGECVVFRSLPRAINKGNYLVPRMNRKERRLAITSALEVLETPITNQLVQQMLNDLVYQAEQLSVLQHVLMRTWLYRRRNIAGDEALDISHYQAIGTMKNAISQHGEEVYASLETEKQKWLCEKIFKQIYKNTEGITYTATIDDLCQITESSIQDVVYVVNKFRHRDCSFLLPVYTYELTPDSVIDIIHDSISRLWIRLAQWIEEEKQSATLYRRLAHAAALYQEGKAALWRDPELHVALQWRNSQKPNAAWAKQYNPSFERAIAFLDYSKKEHDFAIAEKERQQKLRLKRARYFAIIVGTAGLLAILATVYALFQKMEAENNAKLARQKVIEADQSAKIAHEKAKEAQQNADLANEMATKAKQNADTAKRNEEKATKYALALKTTYNELLHKKEELNRQLQIIEEQQSTLTTQNQTLIQQKRQLDEQLHKIENLLIRNRRNYLLSISQNLSVKAIQLLNEEKYDKALQTAMYAHYLNRQKNGAKQNAYNYDALSACYNQCLVEQQNKQNYMQFHKRAVRALTLLPQNNLLFSGDNAGNIVISSTGNKKENIRFNDNEKIRRIAVSENGQMLSVVNFMNQITFYRKGKVLKWNEIWQTQIPDNILQTQFVAIKQTLFFVVISQNNMYFYTVDENKISDIGKIPIAESECAFVYAENQTIITGNGRGVQVYKPKISDDKKSIELKTKHKYKIVTDFTITAITANKQWIAIGNKNGSIVLINTKNKQQSRFTEHVSQITDLEFHPLKNQLASASLDRTVRLWNVDNLREDRLVLKPGNWVWNISFVQNGNQIVAATNDGKLYYYFTSTDLIANAFCEMLRKQNKLQSMQLTQKQWETITEVDNKDGKNHVPALCNPK